jgi:maleylpyruvate isomerase
MAARTDLTRDPAILSGLLNARALTRLIEWAATGIETPMYASADERDEEIAVTATLPARALRHLSETIWMRVREVWIHAVDLGNGASFRDFPAELVDALLHDVSTSWARRRDSEGLPEYRFTATDRPSAAEVSDAAADTVVVTGPAPALVCWATGRGRDGVRTAGGEVPAAPRGI